ncbi:MAG: hypothetical protein F6K28_31920 [Microcoleus sp. SIO2G3]|nr:hypothetical protein [Microcoleus sp. SIO2G3]
MKLISMNAQQIAFLPSSSIAAKRIGIGDRLDNRSLPSLPEIQNQKLSARILEAGMFSIPSAVKRCTFQPSKKFGFG